MIHVNLDGVHINNFTHAKVKMLMAQKYESLGYVDNFYEMACGIPRCRYVKENWDNQIR